MKKTLSILVIGILFISMLSILSPKAKAQTSLYDNFKADSSLNTSFWQVNGPVGTLVGVHLSDIPSTMVAPTITFSSTDGMGFSGVTSSYQCATIQSVQSFSTPTTLTANVMGASPSYAVAFLLGIASADESQGVVIGANLASSSGYLGIWYQTPNGANHWTGYQGPLVSNPSINVLYQVSISVDSSGMATLSISSQGNVLGTASVQVGTANYYTILGQREGAPIQTGPNQAYWQSVAITSSTGPPAGPSVALTLTNTQSIPTGSPFQQMIHVDSAQYSQYEASNLQNVEFYDSNGVVISSWLESGNSNTATDTVYWLKLPSIPANSQITIYMGFASPSVNLFNTQTTGEAPQLSAQYGEYDNGVNVFDNYFNFMGTSLPAGWTQQNWGGGAVSVSNGLSVFTSGSTYSGGTVMSSVSTSSGIIEGYVNSFSNGYNSQVMAMVASSSSVSYEYLPNSVGWQNGLQLETENNNGGTPSVVATSSINPAAPFVLGVYGSSLYVNYNVGTTINGAIFGNGYLTIGVNSGTSVPSIMYDWIRVRTCPPNGVMPSVGIESSLALAVNFPASTTYNTGSIPVQLTSQYATLVFYNVLNGSSWVYAHNQTYVSSTSMTGFVNGSYVFYAWASNNTATVTQTVSFTVDIKPSSSFSIFWITDTQYLSQMYPQKFNDLTNWIIDNASYYNAKMVVHTGDIVQNDYATGEWTNANAAMLTLLNNNIPYLWCAGNHDQVPMGNPDTDWIGSQYQAFNQTVMEKKPYWVSDICDGKDTAVHFKVNNMDFLIVDIEYYANSTVLAWANHLLNDYPNAYTILATHSYIDHSLNYDDPWASTLSSTVLATHSNVFMTLNGHDHGDSGAHQTVGKMNELMFDRQEEDNSMGAATVTILTFDTADNQIIVKTYNLNTGQFMTDPNNQFTLATTFPSAANHDVSIEGVTTSKTVVGRVHSMDINVTAVNIGDFTETFNVTVYANQTIVGEVFNVTLTSGNSKPIPFTWNVTSFSYGHYNLTAYASPTINETNTENNRFVFGIVTVTVLGDANGDGTVNVLDLILIVNHLGHSYPWPYPVYSVDWYKCANTDLNNDGKHNVLDLIICATHLGQHW